MSKEREPLLARWRAQVRELPAAKTLDIPTLNDHLPSLIDELVAALREKSDKTIPEVLEDGSAPAHGRQRVDDDFDVVEVVAEYSILRGCIHELAEQHGLVLRGKSFRIVNRVFDHAIGLALEAYATQRAVDLQKRREEHLAFVAHDLRTPLSAISLAARVLELSMPRQAVGEESARMYTSLRRNVAHLEKLVANILDENANLQTEIGIKLERRELDLWPLVEALTHDLHPVAGTASTKLSNRVPEDLVAYADASLLRRVFQNLIANAIRHTPRGEIVIGAKDLGAEGVECWVSDNGEGIAADVLETIFDKDAAVAGNEASGLGLAIVKAFTDAAGGRLSAESRVGIGSTFRFTLPKRQA
ncbi:MAG: HAMP domain-containing histidine kinase [Candidatus Parcubacteria bacterium]|nr:HAMP domain-containing histidine kinase [Burkholderiales bacterium]